MAQAPTEHLDLLDPAVVARLGQLELIATRIVEGFVAGKHRSPYRGCSIEFAEHRGYSPGDEMRLIDWRVLARSDRYYIKQFEEETNLQSLLVVDASGSMGFGLKTVPKLRYAQMAAACLARMMLHQGDAVGMALLGANLKMYVPPRSKASHLKALLDVLGGMHCQVGQRLQRLLDLGIGSKELGVRPDQAHSPFQHPQCEDHLFP